MEHKIPVIEFENVGKRFFLHRKRQLFAEHALNVVRDATEPFWALQDVSFQVKEGERLAILGPNGAGKTTLLRIISSVMYPSSGVVRIRGRVSALLALGTGLHPDLTGRENVYLIASLMGMTRAQVRAKFDSIVDFSELPRFIDEPVRTYSSGMVARLGFSVAVHSDPDILVLDEVLSVGDAAFTRKSTQQLERFMGSASTLVFVTHSLGAAASMCSRGIWLQDGQIQMDGPVEKVIESYETQTPAEKPAPVEDAVEPAVRVGNNQ